MIKRLLALILAAVGPLCAADQLVVPEPAHSPTQELPAEACAKPADPCSLEALPAEARATLDPDCPPPCVPWAPPCAPPCCSRPAGYAASDGVVGAMVLATIGLGVIVGIVIWVWNSGEHEGNHHHGHH